MSAAFVSVAIVILLSLLVGLVRVAFTGEPVQRMMAAQLLGTGSVGTLVALAAAGDLPVLLDIGLVFAALSAVAVVAFVHRIWRAGEALHDD